jgi:glucose/arabinose dehydrogenase
VRYAAFVLVAAVCSSTLAPRPAVAATPPPGFRDIELFSAVEPTALAYEPGSGNAFVIEKGDSPREARVVRRALASGTVTTALTLTCVDTNGERGLLGIAFDPDYVQRASTRWVYLYYTRSSPSSGDCSIPGSAGSRNRVVRFKESGGVLSGEELLLEGPILTSSLHHNGGTLRFAPDKTLFVSMGDNDTDADTFPLSRDLSDLRGKLLRIARDGTTPNDNPFVRQPGARGEIWAWGLRNPFRFSIDSSTGTPWIADVGEDRWEEIDRGISGADYGYPCFEGNVPFRTCNPAPANPTFPAFVYGHAASTVPFTGSTIIGGPVYRQGNFPPSFDGRLFFGDYGAGWIRSAAIGPGGTLSDVQLFMADAGAVVDIVQAPNGCLGWVDIGTGSIHETCQTSDQDGDGFSVALGDCDDFDPTVFPGAPQRCDGKNNNCSDPNWPTVPANESDLDLDGYRICDGDCNDANPTVHPGALEICNGVDDNCDTVVDEGSALCSDGKACTADVCDGANGCLATHPNVNLDTTGFSTDRIDGSDLVVLADAWNSCPGQPSYNAAANLDQVATMPGACIGDADFHLFMSSFGRSCP